MYDVGIRYTADTEGGSSGSPVFNNQWNLVALHHAGWSGSDGSATNEGIRIASIVDFLDAKNENESNSMLVNLVENVTNFDKLGGNYNKSTLTAKYPQSISGLSDRKGKERLTFNIEGGVDQITIKLG